MCVSGRGYIIYIVANPSAVFVSNGVKSLFALSYMFRNDQPLALYRLVTMNRNEYCYDKSFAEFYDRFDLYENRADVDFFVEEAKRSAGPVLELGCGTGRVLIPTARAGVDICGLDSSEHMLNRCREKLDAEPVAVRERVELIQGDVRDFQLGRQFGLVTLPFRPFQHLTEVNDQIACLQCVRRCLANEGRLILDVFDPCLEKLVDESLLNEQSLGKPFTMPDGRYVRRSERIAERDRARQIQQVELIYNIRHPGGREQRLVTSFPMRYFFRYEVEHLLALCGFEIEDLYSDYKRSPVGARVPGELVFVSHKMS